MNLIAARSSARAVFEAHAKDSSLFHVGRALLGMHAEIAERGAMTLGKGPTSPGEDRPDISYRVEAIDDDELEGAGDIDALLALIPPAPRRTAEIAAAVDAESVAKQLTHAFGIYVERVRLISVADPYADVSWMTDEALD